MIKSDRKVMSAKKEAVTLTNKFENILSIVIVMLATIGILKTLSYSII